MKRILIILASTALAAALPTAGFAQTYSYHPYYPMGQGYYPGNAGVFGIGPGGRVQYHPSYYAVEPGYGYEPNPSDAPPNITGLPSYPMSESYPGFSGVHEPAGYRSHYHVPSAPDPNTALIDVKIPAGARLWVEGQPTHLRGGARGFVSPPLQPGKKYRYDLKAQWKDKSGKRVERTRHVRVEAGSHIIVDFRSPAS